MPADVCMVVEGTYPYLTGGVSTWVHQLISSMPQLTFAIAHISTQKDPTRRIKYELPGNVVEIRDLYLHQHVYSEPGKVRRRCLQSSDWKRLREQLRMAARGEAFSPATMQGLGQKFDRMEDFIATVDESKEGWQFICELYEEFANPGTGILDFFWAARSIQLPLLGVLYQAMPDARVYHSASTGYAGGIGGDAIRA